MALILVSEDSAYQCKTCGNLFNMRKGQLLPPCPRCGGQMEKCAPGSTPESSSCCG